MAERNGQSYGQWSGTVQISSVLITTSKDREDKQKRNDQLDPHSLSIGQRFIDPSHTKVSLNTKRGQDLKKAWSDNCTQALGHDEENRPDEADLASYQHANRDGWVDVTTAYVSNAPNNRGNSQTKAERDVELSWGVVGPVFPDARPASYEDEEESSKSFCDHGSIEEWVREVI